MTQTCARRDARQLFRCGIAVVAALVLGCGGGGEAPLDAATPPDATTTDGPSGNATLAALTAAAGVLTPPFEPEVNEYDLDLVLAEPDVAFTPTAAAPGTTTITVDGADVSSGTSSPILALTPGSRDVEIVVVAAGGATQTYRVRVHRGVDALASLTPSSGALAPLFDPAILSYALPLPLAIATVAWTPTLLTPGRASITVDGVDVPSATSSTAAAIAVGENARLVVVTPLTRPLRSYDLGVVRGAELLTSITPSYGGGDVANRLIPAFDPTTTTYAVEVGLSVQSLQVAVTPLYAASTMTVNGNAVAAGTPTAPISLGLGLTSIPIVVTAPGALQQSYTLNVTRASALLQKAYVKASNTGASDTFGYSVAMSGDTLAVGAAADFAASGEDSAATGVGGDQTDNSAAGSGAVYVFTRTGNTWSQQAYLKASNTGAGDGFGYSVAMWGDTLAVGAWEEDSTATGIGGDQTSNGASNSGAVYVFTRTGTTWSQQAYVKASNAGANDYFGVSVALWGDTLAVGAYREASAATGVGGIQADNTAAQSGAVYTFTRTGTIWSQQAYIKASNTDAGDWFGSSITLWGDTLAVGAVREASAATGIGGNQADDTAAASGAVYVFTRTGTTWSQQAYLKASNTEAVDQFGASVALSGDTLAVGAHGEDSVATGVGGNQVDNTATDSGAVYVFTRTGTTWSQQAYVKASNTGTIDMFGVSVALRGDTLAVGASQEASGATGLGGDQADNTQPQSGAVYLLTRTGTAWSQQAYVKASNTGASDNFGRSVALSGDTLAVGADGERSTATGVGGNQSNNSATDSGAVYVFH